MSGYDCLNKCNFSFPGNSDKDCTAVMLFGRLFGSCSRSERTFSDTDKTHGPEPR